MIEFKEKKIWLVKMQNRLTASNAYMVDNVFIPKVENLLFGNSCYCERIDLKRNRYLLIFCEEEILSSCIKELRFVSSYQEVTDQIVDGDYDKIVRWFDTESFYRLYEAHYLNHCPVDFARKRIKAMGNKSRYIDHKIMFMHNEKL